MDLRNYCITHQPMIIIEEELDNVTYQFIILFQ